MAKRKGSFRRRSLRPRKFRRTSRRRTRRASVTVNKGPSPVSDKYITWLNYTELLVFAYTGTLKYYQFNLNNINDPNRTGTGHQPMGHDQLALLYGRYRVTGCTYDIMLSNTNATYQGEVVVLLRPDADVMATFEDAMESPYRIYRALPSEGGSLGRIKGYANLTKIFGITRTELMTDTDYYAGMGGNPSNQAVLTIYVQNQEPATAININARVNLRYCTQFFDRNVLGSS